MTATDRIKSGIPSLSRFLALEKSDDFGEMETFSNIFLKRYKRLLRHYSNKWVRDPLHTWSRQWEYPFVLQAIERELSSSSRKKRRILDAGSGATFFPFYLKEKHPEVSVSCCDIDHSVKKVFEGVNSNKNSFVPFFTSDICSIPALGKFDIIYCISVLEHLSSHRSAIDAFQSALTDKGLLIVTFDISLDCKADISPKDARQLLKNIETQFTPIDQADLDPDQLSDNTDILTTRYFKENDPTKLPWQTSVYQKLKASIKGKTYSPHFTNTTCFCSAFRKRHKTSKREVWSNSL